MTACAYPLEKPYDLLSELWVFVMHSCLGGSIFEEVVTGKALIKPASPEYHTRIALSNWRTRLPVLREEVEVLLRRLCLNELNLLEQCRPVLELFHPLVLKQHDLSFVCCLASSLPL